MLMHEFRRQLLACFESLANVIHFALMADFNFGFTEDSFLLQTSQKGLRSLAEDLVSKNQ